MKDEITYDGYRDSVLDLEEMGIVVPKSESYNTDMPIPPGLLEKILGGLDERLER